MESFRELIVWQRAMELSLLVYQLTKTFPEAEKFGLTNQIRRSSVSIPSNIAEGYGRGSTADYIRFLKISRGSLFELQTQSELSVNLGFLHPVHFQNIESLANEVGRMLNTLIKKLEAKLVEIK